MRSLKPGCDVCEQQGAVISVVVFGEMAIRIGGEGRAAIGNVVDVGRGERGDGGCRRQLGVGSLVRTRRR